MALKICKKCGESKELSTTYFNLLKSGGWRGTCKSCMALNTKKHYGEHPEKLLKRVAEYKLRLKNAVGSHTSRDLQQIREKQGDICYYCSTKLFNAGEFDHATPLSRGGSNSPSNIVLACRTCNRDKRDKTAAEYFLWLHTREPKSKF